MKRVVMTVSGEVGVSVSAAIKQARQVRREREEQAALHQIAQRIAAQLPEVAHEVIVRTIRGEYEQFADSRVRDFVPVLVERRARAGLRESSTVRTG
jgi:hypothetical protein